MAASRLAWLLIGWTWAAGAQGAAADITQTRTPLDREFQAQLEALAVRCEELGLPDEARVTRGWAVVREPRRQYLFLAGEADRTTPAADAPQLKHQWHRRFLELRGEHAAGLFQLSRQALDQHDATAAYQLLHEVLREDPDHEQARRILGVGGSSPAGTMRRRPGRSAHPLFGWQRNEYWRIDAPHFRITTNDSAEAGVRLAEQLEAFHQLWQQLFFLHWSSPAALAARFEGRAESLGPEPKHEVILFRDRQEYIDQLSKVEPQIAVSLGYYVKGRRTAFFYAGDESLQATWFHEATHQLFQERGVAVEDVGEKWNSWIVEGIAVYMESLRPHDGYWSVGGWDADRLQYARARTLKGGWYLPLEELVKLGREDLQQHPEIRAIYSQAAALTHLLMDGQGGQFRRALIALLQAVYLGRDSPRSLALLTETELETLDAAYARFLDVRDEELAQLRPHVQIRNLMLGRTSVTDAGLKHLAACQQLEWLDVSFTPVTDSGVEHLRDLPKLQQLSLEGCHVTDRALAVISRLTQLQQLDLSGTAVTDAGVAQLSELVNLKELWLTDTAVTDASLERLQSLQKLEHLDVNGTQVSEAAWSEFRKRLVE